MEGVGKVAVWKYTRKKKGKQLSLKASVRCEII